MGSRKNWGQKKIGSVAKNGDVTLLMECGSQPLSEIQVSVKNKIEDEYNQFMQKFTESMSKKNAEIIEQGNQITVYEIDCTPNLTAAVVPKDITNTANASAGLMKPTSTLITTSQSSTPLIPSSSVLLPSGTVASTGTTVFAGQPGTYQLVVSPRVGLIVTPSTPGATTVAASTSATPASPLPVVRPTAAARVQVKPGLTNAPPSAKRFPSPAGPSGKIMINPATQKSNVTLTKQSVSQMSTINTRSKGKLMPRQHEVNSAEGLHSMTATAKSEKDAGTNTVVDLTEDDGKAVSDSREITLNRYPGRIYPSLVVVARPQLRIKDLNNSVITSERTALDTKVKGILTNSPTKFTEWLIQQGLVRSEQVCATHTNNDMTPVKLKLGMYSDASKFPHSGGYVWISDCCPQKFVSVFCNSIFEGAPHAPTVLLKLIYHWSCQTNVHNIISWVKVDNHYIKTFFTNLRAVCTAAICEKFGKMGGVGKKIEVGVISLGTTSQNGNVRQVKVEVLGIMDPVSKTVRLRAVDPVQSAEKNHKLRFSRILESLEQWVHKNTTIITDYTVDKSTLNDLGFHSVVQVQLNATQNRESNQAIMDYLKRVVPRMFQNTLSLLSRSIIQQFLDELVWRERWGPIPSRAFDNLILHLSEITKLDTGDTLVNRLKSITANPFRDWSYKNWKYNGPSSGEMQKRPDLNEPDVGNKLTISKNTTARSKANVTVVNRSNKANSLVTLTVDDSSDEGTIMPSIDNLPPSITDIEDDNASVSSNGSRRSRNRNSWNEDGKVTGGSSKSGNDSLLSVLKSLETFYYGVLPPDVVVVNKLKKVDLNMKCFVCGLMYNNNILFMKHLAGHAQNEGAFTTDYQCRYCLKNLTSPYDLEDHLGNSHVPSKYNSMCLICGERFKFRVGLIKHMQNIHVELELPYLCTICKFRCSEHTKAIDHFYEVHDGGEKVQCPFCLKTVAFESSNKTKLTQNVNFFFSHIKRHQQKRKCPKCVLSFVNKIHLKEHMAKDHLSCIHIPGVIRHQFLEMATVLMPMPSIIPLAASRKGKLPSSIIPSFSSYKLDNMLQYPDVAPSTCFECKSLVSLDQHFRSYLNCMKCMFSSCCQTVMLSHLEKFHDYKGKRKIPQRKMIPLEKPLYCVCGFSSSCGNNMASHLVHCKRRSAYPNPERAAQYAVLMPSASFPAFVNLDDVEQGPNDASDKWLRAFVKNVVASDTDDKLKRTSFSDKSPPRMLKELGLVRKESSSVDADENMTGEPNEVDDEKERRESVGTEKNSQKMKQKRSDEEISMLSGDEVDSLDIETIGVDNVMVRPLKKDTPEQKSFGTQDVALAKTNESMNLDHAPNADEIQRAIEAITQNDVDVNLLPEKENFGSSVIEIDSKRSTRTPEQETSKQIVTDEIVVEEDISKSRSNTGDSITRIETEVEAEVLCDSLKTDENAIHINSEKTEESVNRMETMEGEENPSDSDVTKTDANVISEIADD